MSQYHVYVNLFFFEFQILQKYSNLILRLTFLFWDWFSSFFGIVILQCISLSIAKWITCLCICWAIEKNNWCEIWWPSASDQQCQNVFERSRWKCFSILEKCVVMMKVTDEWPKLIIIQNSEISSVFMWEICVWFSINR